MKKKLKNPYFWVGLLGVILTAMGADPTMFTSWGAVLTAFLDLVQNPFMLGTVTMAVIGVITDTTDKSTKEKINDAMKE